MSAFIVSKEHIDALVQAGLESSRYGDLSWRHDDEWHYLRRENADEVGAMLWGENIASVQHRYSPAGREAIYGEAFDTPEQSLPGKYQLETIAPGVEPIETPEWSTEYRFRALKRRTAVEVLKLLACFEYQACEHDEWETSEAYALCDALRRALINSLPGYADAKWSL